MKASVTAAHNENAIATHPAIAVIADRPDPSGSRASASHDSVSLRKRGAGVYLGVQALRGLAAMLVLLQHNSLVMSERTDDPRFLINFGQSGVDIFFAISGFVMVLVTAGAWGRSGAVKPFLVKRVIRIVPLYWLFTALKVLLILLIPGLALGTVLTPWLVVSSFLFLPNGFATPVMQVGWTLNYEFLFYLLFAAGLAARSSVAVLFLPLAVLSIAGHFGAVPLGVPMWQESLLLLEFMFGMMIALSVLRGYVLPPRTALAIAAGALIVILMSEHLADPRAYRVIVWGIPGAALLLAVTSLEPWFRNSTMKWPVQLGAASYSLYLVHPFVVGVIWVAISKAHLMRGYLSYVDYGAVIAASVAAAWIVHVVIEKPITLFLSRRFDNGVSPMVPDYPLALRDHISREGKPALLQDRQR